MKQLRLLISGVFAALLLAGCGGSSPETEVPQESQMQREDRTASATIAGLIGFAKAQIASFTSDTAGPRDVSGINPPTTETEEPAPL